MSELKWIKTGRIVWANGEATTTYKTTDGKYKIESRKRNIPHANRDGYWQHTSYFLISPDGSEKEYYSLRDAKAAVEVSE